MSGLAVVATDLAKSFDEQVAVAGIDLEITSGEVFGFLGPDGAGKSTSIRMLCTLTRPTAGSARVAGYDLATEATRIRPLIGVTLHDTVLDRRQTGREALAVQGRLYGLRRAALAERIDRTLELIEIGDTVDRRIGACSVAVQRRLDLAAALVHGPDIVLLDEPTTGLDPDGRAQVWDEVERLNTELGITILVTTPAVDEAARLAHRVGIIDGGRIVVEGTPEHLGRAVGDEIVLVDLAGQPDDAVAALQSLDGVDGVLTADGQIRVVAADGAALVARVATVLGAAGLQPRSITVRTPTLADVFLHATGHGLESAR